MRIGVDASPISGPITGIGRYASELLKELVQLDSQFFLYTPKVPIIRCEGNDRTVLRSARFPGRIGKMIWSQTTLPHWATLDKVDIFWGTTHRLPQYLPLHIAKVVTIHDLTWKIAGQTMAPVSRWLEQRFMPKAVYLADRIMTDSKSTAEALATEFPEVQHKVRVVHLGVSQFGEADTFESLSALGIIRPFFLFVGTMEPRKNLRALLKAFASIPDSIRSSALLVIAGGKGWGGVDPNQLLDEYNLTKQAVVTGYVTEEQLITLYTHARFLAMPSIYEGFGLPLVESMSCGTPVLTSNISSLPEVAGDAGLLINPLDERSIAEGLLVLLTNNHLLSQLAKNAKKQAMLFSWKKAAQHTMDIFLEAVAEKRNHI